MHGDSKKDLLAPTSFHYSVKSLHALLSIPSVRCDLGDSSHDSIAKIVEVTYKLDKVVACLKKYLERLAPDHNGGDAKVLDTPIAPTIAHDESYKDFLHNLHLERYANINAVRNLYKLDSNVEAWAIPEDLEKGYSTSSSAPATAVSTQAQVGDDHLTTDSACKIDIGEIAVNEMVVHRVVQEGRVIADVRQREQKELTANAKTMEEVVKILPLMASSFSAFSRSLSTFPALRDACGTLKRAVFAIGRSNGKAKGSKLSEMEKKVDQAISRIDAFTPDRVAAKNLQRVFEDLLNTCRKGAKGELSARHPTTPPKKVKRAHGRPKTRPQHHRRKPDVTRKRRPVANTPKKRSQKRSRVRSLH